MSNKQIKLARRSAAGHTGGRRARSLSAVRSAEPKALRDSEPGIM